MAQRVLRLGDADREAAEPVPLVALELAAGERGVVDPVGAVDLGRDRLDLLPERRLGRVQEVEVAGLGRHLGDRLGDLGRAAAAVGEVRADRGPDAHRRCDLRDRGALGREVGGHRVDRDDRLDAVRADVLQLLAQVGRADQHVLGVLGQHPLGQRAARHHPVLAGVALERADGRDHHGGVRP